MIWGAAVVRNVLFGMLVASTLAPWGTIKPSRRTSEHEKGDLGVQTWISSIFLGFRGSILQVFHEISGKCTPGAIKWLELSNGVGSDSLWKV